MLNILISAAQAELARAGVPVHKCLPPPQECQHKITMRYSENLGNEYEWRGTWKALGVAIERLKVPFVHMHGESRVSTEGDFQTTEHLITAWHEPVTTPVEPQKAGG